MPSHFSLYRPHESTKVEQNYTSSHSKWNVYLLIINTLNSNEGIPFHSHFLLCWWIYITKKWSADCNSVPDCKYPTTVTCLWMCVCFKNSAGKGFFPLCHHIHTGPGVHLASYPIRTMGSFPGGKTAGAWSWPSTPFSAKIKKALTYTCTPPICLHGMVLNKALTASSWHGTKFHTGTTLYLPLPICVYSYIRIVIHMEF
jgi:hypothetical protein